MSMETDVRSLILSDGGVSALIGARLYPLRLPQDVTLPAATYQRIVTTPHNTLTGAHGSATALLQLDSYAPTYGGAEALSEALMTAIDGVTQSGDLQAILTSNLLPLYDVDLSAYRVMTEFRISYTNS